MLNKFFQSLSIMKLSNLLMIFAWWLIPLWMYGVFDDGMFYSSISRNLIFDAQATIWDLKISNTLDYKFNGHPPLAFWIQSLFFWCIGDVYWVERFFSLLMGCCSIFLIHKCWKLFYKEGSSLVIFFWMCIPIVAWSYSNNMLENVLTLFTTTAVWIQLKGILSNKSWIPSIIFASLFIFGGTLVKGPVALFPLVTYGIYALLFNRSLWWKSIGATFAMISLMVTFYCLLFTLSPRALLFFKDYFELQIKGSLSGMDSLAAHRLFLLQSVIEESLIIVAILAGMKLLTHFFKVPVNDKINWRLAFFWFLIACSASLPMLISPKQLRFYIVPSMLFYSLGFATIIYPIFKALIQEFQQFNLLNKLLKLSLIGGLFLCIVLSEMNKGKFARSYDVLPDSMVIGKTVPPHTEIHIPPSLFNVWNLHAYLYRYFYIDLSTVFEHQDYLLLPKDKTLKTKEYKEVELDLQSFKLYQRRVKK